MDEEGNMSSSAKRMSGDQYFLLNFIMSNYLGPDLYSDNPRCSASQRLARSLPPYTLKHLGSSFLSVAQLESLYYYILRYAKSNLVIEPNIFQTYLKGDLPLVTSDSAAQFRQFTSFFPLNVHERKRYSATHEIVKGIVLIDNPAVSYINKEDLQRFRCLSRLDDLKIDSVISLSCRRRLDESQGEEQYFSRNGEVMSTSAVSYQNRDSSSLQETCKRKNEETVSENAACGTSRNSNRFLVTYKRRRRNRCPKMVVTPENRNTSVEINKRDQPVVQPVAAVPSIEEHVSDASIKMTGTAAKRTLGGVGMVDIGISKVAYFFQVSLPGICKGYREFSCEVESDGKVILQGTRSGGKTIKKRSRVFEMNLRQLCPPGPFTLSFTLPGPVDPRLFSPNFRSDGIFEAVIIRHKP